MLIQTNRDFHINYLRTEPKFTYSGIVTTDSSWKQEPIYSSDSRLYYIEFGSGILYSNTESIELLPGYVYLAPCGTECGFYGTPFVKKLFFHFNLFLTENNQDAFDGYGHFAKLPRSVEYINNLKDIYSSSDSLSALKLKCELISTIYEFLDLNAEKSNGFLKFSSPVSTALGYIRKNLSTALSSREVAEAALCSQSKLSLLFSREVGKSISRYIEDLIMSEAQMLLLSSNHTILQICEKLGYYDQFYFSRRFKLRFGISPSKYRNNSKI